MVATRTRSARAERKAPGAVAPRRLVTEGPVADYLRDLHFRISRITDGKVASYIPELAKVSSHACAIAMATIDGSLYAAGDFEQAFTIQSVSKPFVYGYALTEYGRETVMRRVGVEPTGEAFNSIVLDDVHNRPFNPMVNAGAIATAEMLKGETREARARTMMDLFSRYAGRSLELDEAVYRSEDETGHRNRAIAYMMLNSGMIRRDPADILDVYFRQCSVRVDACDLALMGACLANDGVNPLTGVRVIDKEYVHDVLTVMNTCGMYNFAGQWSYEIGMPAKSGVSGSILAVIPGQAAVAIYSPPIDENGNSVRGLAACREIAEEFGLHVFRTHPNARAVVRREFYGDAIRSKRTRTRRERALLDAEGQRICVIELQDALFFGSSEFLLRRAAAAEAEMLVLDLRRVTGADAAAIKLLARLAASLEAQGRTLIFAHLRADGPLSELHAHFAESESPIFANRDAALEWCENQLIDEAESLGDGSKFALAGLEIFRGLDATQLRELEAMARPLIFDAGDVIVKEGDAGRLFFVIARGVASICVRQPDTERSVRIASVGPGVSFGEMALLDGGRRSADVIADERVICYGFSVEELQELGRTQPAILITMFGNMARDLSERLRRANSEIRALED